MLSVLFSAGLLNVVLLVPSTLVLALLLRLCLHALMQLLSAAGASYAGTRVQEPCSYAGTRVQEPCRPVDHPVSCRLAAGQHSFGPPDLWYHLQACDTHSGAMTLHSMS
jgi:hypothetical protein